MKLSPFILRRQAAFTMVEIAICLAIIGIALVGIIGILPYGMNTQRDTREETLINQDVTMLLPAITQGMRGVDDLTNYVYAITNYWGLYKTNGTLAGTGVNGYAYNGSVLNASGPPFYSQVSLWLTNGLNIVGLLSTPEFVADTVGNPAVPLIDNADDYQVYSNHIVAYVHALSGLASEKPPQDNSLLVNDAFTYRLLVVNAPVPLDANSYDTPYHQQIWRNQRELRLTFLSPQQPNGTVGNNRLTYRATVAGVLAPTNAYNNQVLYFYGPQFFNANTNL